MALFVSAKRREPGVSLNRRFDGQRSLDAMLAKSGSLGDVEDIVQAFRDAIAKGVPPQPVIMGLWQDEPRFESPQEAEALFANLLGLYDLVASGKPFNVEKNHRSIAPKPRTSPRPPPIEGDDVSSEWLEDAWQYLEATPKKRDQLGHAFDNRLDGLVSVIDGAGLSDAGFSVARELCFELFAMFEIGGRRVGALSLQRMPQKPTLPAAVIAWVEEGLIDAEDADEQPLPANEREAVQRLVIRLVSAMWGARSA